MVKILPYYLMPSLGVTKSGGPRLLPEACSGFGRARAPERPPTVSSWEKSPQTTGFSV